jgi:short-subunit dehydrogenase
VDRIKCIDLLINIPVQSAIGSVNDTPFEKYKQELDANFFGTLYLLAELFKKEQKPKKIINILSSLVITGGRYHSSYACTMAAFWTITRSLRRIYGNELQVMEVIFSPGASSVQALKTGNADIDHFTGKSPADAVATKIYRAEKGGKEIVVTPFKIRLLLAIEALTPRVHSKVYT